MKVLVIIFDILMGKQHLDVVASWCKAISAYIQWDNLV